MAGGGGFGDPLTRTRKEFGPMCSTDKVTLGHAREAYGVVIASNDEERQVDAGGDTRTTRCARGCKTTMRDERMSTVSAHPSSPAISIRSRRSFGRIPSRLMRELRELGPIVWLNRHDIWVVSRYDRVREVLERLETFQQCGRRRHQELLRRKALAPPSLILEVDPPDHQRTRKVFMDVLSPARLQRLRPAFEAQAEQLIDEALERGTFDAIPDLVQRFPLTVFPDAVGMQREDRSNMLVYGSMVFGGFGPTTPWYEELMKQARGCLGVDHGALPARRARTRRHWRSDLCARRCGQHRTSGSDTARALAAVRRRRYDHRFDRLVPAMSRRASGSVARLRADPIWRAPRSKKRRVTTRRASRCFARRSSRSSSRACRSASIRKCWCSSAPPGRDPAKWTNPDSFDITRRVTAAQIGYGAGAHSCVAQMMARLEGEIFFRALARKVQDIEIVGTPQLRLKPGTARTQQLAAASHAQGRLKENSQMGNVIVAGGATGIGRAAVRGFRARGDNVLLVDHRPQAADLATEQAPGAIRFIQRDLADPAAPAEMVSAAVAAFGSLDTVLITAALMLSAPLSDWTQDMWDRSVALNLRMPFLFAQAAAPQLAKSDNASLIFISSTGAIRGHAGMSAYQATKAALPGLCRSLTAELGPLGHPRQHDHAGLDRYAVQRSVLGVPEKSRSATPGNRTADSVATAGPAGRSVFDGAVSRFARRGATSPVRPSSSMAATRRCESRPRVTDRRIIFVECSPGVAWPRRRRCGCSSAGGVGGPGDARWRVAQRRMQPSPRRLCCVSSCPMHAAWAETCSRSCIAGQADRCDQWGRRGAIAIEEQSPTMGRTASPCPASWMRGVSCPHAQGVCRSRKSLRPAIRLARTGMRVSPTLAVALATHRARLQRGHANGWVLFDQLPARE